MRTQASFFFRIFYAVLCVFLLFGSSGCGTFGVYNPATGRREFIAVSTVDELNMGKNLHENIKKKFHLSDNPAWTARVENVGENIALVSDRQDYVYKFFVLEDEEVNAFTTPGGYVYCNTGLLKALPDDDQLAAVLAHEIAHCAARHVVKKYQASLGYDILHELVFSNLSIGVSAKSLANLSSGVLINLIFSAYSRKDEYEADRIGLRYMSLAGYRPEGMIETLTVLQEKTEGPQAPEILRSHPYLKDRIREVSEEIQRTNNPS